jgi:outer membrane receptor protein involved in Fe transport
LNSKQRLPAFAVLQASLTKEFDHFAALVTIKNLLDTDYVIWENYPETGLTAMAGIMAKF